MENYKDYVFEINSYNTSKSYSGVDALVLAARNILLSRPGNFPFHPSLGMNIKQYQFEFLDDDTILEIQNKFEAQTSEYLPSLESLKISIMKLEDDYGRAYLGISIASILNGSNISANFLVRQNGEEIEIINETIV